MTQAIASAAQTGWFPVANATNVRIRLEPAAATARRRAIPEGPPEPAAATIMPVRAARRVALTWGKGALSATPATRPDTM